jgi:hypothetical protein
MPVSTFFNNYRSSTEQALVEDLVIESIKQYGLDVYYLPYTSATSDTLYGEARLKVFSGNYPVEMFIKNIDGFGGDGDFLSKFNIQINDTMTLTVAVRQFMRLVANQSQLPRPREGDLIFFPLNNKVYEIKFVEHEPVFYQMGALQMYDIKVELFTYNNQIFNTGIQAVDDIYTNNTLDTNVNSDIITQGVEVADPVADNTQIQREANTVINFDELDPFSEGQY